MGGGERKKIQEIFTSGKKTKNVYIHFRQNYSEGCARSSGRMGSSSMTLAGWSRGVPGDLGRWESPKERKGAWKSAVNFDRGAAQTKMTAPQAGPRASEVARSSASKETPPRLLLPRGGLHQSAGAIDRSASQAPSIEYLYPGPGQCPAIKEGQ